MDNRTLRLLACSAFVALASPAFAQALSVEVVSSRPELVTGGDALVRIAGADAAPSVSVGGTDVRAVSELKESKRIPKSAEQ